MNGTPALRSAAMPSYFPLLLGAHIILAVSLVLPSILLPFALRTRRAAVESGVDSFVSLYATQTEVGSEFGRRVQADGLKAALEWRRAQFQT